MSRVAIAMYVIVAIVLSAVIAFALVRMTPSMQSTSDVIVVPQTMVASATLVPMMDTFAQLVRDDEFVAMLAEQTVYGYDGADTAVDNAHISVSVPADSMIRITVTTTVTEDANETVGLVVSGITEWVNKYYSSEYQLTPMPMVTRQQWDASAGRIVWVTGASLAGGFALSALIFALMTLLPQHSRNKAMHGNLRRGFAQSFDMQSRSSDQNFPTLQSTISSPPQAKVATTVEDSMPLFRDVNDLEIDVPDTLNTATPVNNEADYMRMAYTDYDQHIADTMNTEASEITSQEVAQKEVAQNAVQNVKQDEYKSVKKSVKKIDISQSTKNIGKMLKKIAVEKVAQATPPINLPIPVETAQSTTTQDTLEENIENKTKIKSTSKTAGASVAEDSNAQPTPADIKRRLNELLSGKIPS